MVGYYARVMRTLWYSELNNFFIGSPVIDMQRANRRILNRWTSFGLADGWNAGRTMANDFNFTLVIDLPHETRVGVHHMELKVYRSFLEYVITLTYGALTRTMRKIVNSV